MSRKALLRLVPLLLGLSLAIAPALRADDEEPEDPAEKAAKEVAAYEKEIRDRDTATQPIWQEEQAHFQEKKYSEALNDLGRLAAAVQNLKIRKELKEDQEGAIQYDYACAYARLDKKEEAFKALARAFEHGYADWKHADEDEDLETLRKDPEYKKTVDEGKKGQADRAAARVKEALGQKPLFDFPLDEKTIEAKPLKLADLKGKAVIVYVLSSGRPECQEQLKVLAALYKEYQSKGLEIVGLCCEVIREDVEKDLRKFANKNGQAKFPLIAIDRDEGPKKYVPGFLAFPTTLFLDKDGKVRLKETGFNASRTTYDYYEAHVKALLDAKAGEGK